MQERKNNMDKEMIDKIKACKTADEMKALLGNRRALSEAELEQVNGGGLIIGDWNIETPEDLNSFVFDFCGPIYDMDPNILINVLQYYLPSYGIKREILAFGLDGLYNHLALIMEDGSGSHFH